MPRCGRCSVRYPERALSLRPRREQSGSEQQPGSQQPGSQQPGSQQPGSQQPGQQQSSSVFARADLM